LKLTFYSENIFNGTNCLKQAI